MRKPTVSSDRVAGDQLRAFIERIERMDEEIKALNADKKEIFAEAKGNGFDTKVIKMIIKERRQDASERMETEALLELYRAALGMASAPRDDEDEGGDEGEPETGTPVATRAPARDDDLEARKPDDKVAAALRTSERRAKVIEAAGATKVDLTNSAAPINSQTPPGSEVAAHQAGEGSDALPADTEPSNLQNLQSAPAPSTAARKDVLGPEGMEGASPSPDRTLAELGEAPSAGDQAEPGAGAAAPPVDTRSPHDVADQAGPAASEAGLQDFVAGKSGEGAGALTPAPTAAENARKLRPWCLHADNLNKCAGAGRKHCYGCLKAHAEEVGETA